MVRWIVGLVLSGGIALVGLLYSLSPQGEEQVFEISRPKAKAVQPSQQGSWVGVGEADITPPPGRWHSGYAAAGQTGQGFRTRLWARAFYIKDHEGRLSSTSVFGVLPLSGLGRVHLNVPCPESAAVGSSRRRPFPWPTKGFVPRMISAK